ncbi:MAG: hypothetical protein WBP13_03025 [Methylophilaceae bacterium]
MQLHIGGDCSALALVNPKKYVSFVGEDWYENKNLINHLITQTNQLNILMWGTGFEFDWIVEFKEGISNKNGFREFTGFLNNQDDALFLMNYDSLTMAAQFDDIELPDKETAKYRVNIPNGLYKFRVLQLVDTSQDGWWNEFADVPAFTIEYERVPTGSNNINAIPWYDL